MKLSKYQYQDILKLIDKFQISHERLSLVKKKGRIRVQIKDVNSTFEFFKRKSVSLSEDGKEWLKSEYYELNVDGSPALLADWQEVLTHLNKWLQSQGK